MSVNKTVFCVILIVMMSGCAEKKKQSILAWDPTPEELPTANYPEEFLSEDSTGWNWSGTSDHEIQDVWVAPPIYPENPYLLGEDYEGYLEGNIAHIHFISPGVYTVRFRFKDSQQSSYIKFLYAGAAPSGIAKE